MLKQINNISLLKQEEISELLVRRVTDGEVKQESAELLELKAQQYLKNNNQQILPMDLPGTVITSETWRTAIKDNRFFINSLATQLSNIDKEMNVLLNNSINQSKDIQQLISTVDSFLTEEEIRTYQNVEHVHYNSFARTEDAFSTDFLNAFNLDFKTGLTFSKQQIMSYFNNVGLSLPIMNETVLPIESIYIVEEDSDSGDFTTSIKRKNSANGFEYIIYKKSFDEHGNKISSSLPIVTYGIDFSHLNSFNYLEIQTISGSDLEVLEISYLNEAGQEIILSQNNWIYSNALILFFAPIRCKALNIKIQAGAAITYGDISNRDIDIDNINKILSGHGFSFLLNEKSESGLGYLYDFSLKKIIVKSIVYDYVGFFLGKTLNVDNAISCILQTSNATIPLIRTDNGYLYSYTFPAAEVYDEKYLCMEVGSKHFSIPVPDTENFQIENLPLVGDSARLKFLPNLQAGFQKYKIDYVEVKDGAATITFVEKHYLTSDGSLFFESWNSHPLNGSFDYVISDDYRIDLTLVADNSYVIASGETPFCYAYSLSSNNTLFEVYSNDTLLTIGSDYLITFDNGVSYHNEFLYGEAFKSQTKASVAGDCRIKFTNPKFDIAYAVKYKPLKHQYLDHFYITQLEEDAIVFNSQYKNIKLAPLIIKRSASKNIYITSLMEYYCLKVESHVG